MRVQAAKLLVAVAVTMPLALASACRSSVPPAVYALNDGSEALLAGDFEGALKHYDKAIALDPRYASAHCMRGEALLRLKRADVALSAFRECVRLKPRDANALMSLAVGAVIACEYTVAKQALADFENVGSTDSRLTGNAAWVELKLDQALALNGRCLPPEATKYP